MPVLGPLFAINHSCSASIPLGVLSFCLLSCFGDQILVVSYYGSDELLAVVGRVMDCACGRVKCRIEVFLRCRVDVISVLQILRFLCLCSACAVVLATS